MRRFSGSAALAVFTMVFWLIAPSAAQAGGYRPTVSEIDPEVLKMDESKFLGKKLSGKIVFMDDRGEEFTLGGLRGKPLIMVLSYFTCDGACPAFNAELIELLDGVTEMGRIKPGKDYKVLTLSFDRNDNAVTANHFRKMLEAPETLDKNWVLATFKNPEEIEPFTAAIDYNFFWSAADRMFFHPNAFIFLSPEGRIVRVLHNSKVEPKDMELAIIDTRFNRLKPSEILTMAISLCYSYNYKEGKYGLNYPIFIAFGSLFIGIGAFVYGAFWIKRKSKAKEMTA